MTEKTELNRIGVIQNPKQRSYAQGRALLAECFRRATGNEELIFLECVSGGFAARGLLAYELREAGEVASFEHNLGAIAVVHCNGVGYSSLTKSSGLREKMAEMPPGSVINRNYALKGHFDINSAARQQITTKADAPGKRYRLWVANGGVIHGGLFHEGNRQISRLIEARELPESCLQIVDEALPRIAEATGDIDPRTIAAEFEVIAGASGSKINHISPRPSRIHSMGQMGSNAFGRVFAKAEVAAMLALRHNVMS